LFVIGFDFGIKYIGVAIGQKITKTVTPLASILVTNKKEKWKLIFECINTWSPSEIIVGYPFDSGFSNNDILKELDNFINYLTIKCRSPIFLVDENLSTWNAKKNIFFSKNKKNKKYFFSVNAMSAVILLEQWFFDNRFNF